LYNKIKIVFVIILNKTIVIRPFLIIFDLQYSHLRTIINLHLRNETATLDMKLALAIHV